MSNTEKKRQRNFQEPWWIRRAGYIIAGAVLLGLAGFGLIDEGQVDAITASPLLGTIVAWIAAAKTNEGSDSTTTNRDVEVSREARAHLDRQILDLRDQVTAQLQDTATSLTDYLPGRVQEAVESIYRAPHGEHELREQEHVAAPETPEEQARREALAYYRQSGEG